MLQAGKLEISSLPISPLQSRALEMRQKKIMNKIMNKMVVINHRDRLPRLSDAHNIIEDTKKPSQQFLLPI